MNPISILIVEGNPSFLRVETFFFQKHCRAEAVVAAAAGRGEEALAQAKALRPDVILFDLAVYGCGGPAMIARLKKTLPDTTIIARGWREGESNFEALLSAGVDDFVSKFASPTELLPVIRRARANRMRRRAHESATAFKSLKHRALEKPLMKKHGKPITILMADDEATDCLLVKAAVERAHLHNDLHFVENGVELMDYLHRRGKYSKASNAPRPGLILLDLNMPRKDGREALAEIKADEGLRGIPVVVLTVSKADEDFWRARNLGADMYLIKPVTFETLINVVKSLGRYWFEIVELPQATGVNPSPARSDDAAVPVA